MPPTTAASREFAVATIRHGIFFSRASIAIERTPRTARFPVERKLADEQEVRQILPLQQAHTAENPYGKR